MSGTKQVTRKGRTVAVHLSDWSDADAIEAARAVQKLIEDPGFAFLERAFASREKALLTEQLSKPATDTGAVYAKALGHIDGRRQLRPIAEGIVNNGRTVEETVRAREAA